jgi:hypothetical protein
MEHLSLDYGYTARHKREKKIGGNRQHPLGGSKIPRLCMNKKKMSEKRISFLLNNY